MDSRFVARKLRSADGAGGSFQIWEYLVDVPGPNGGAPVRLTFKVRGAPERGDVVHMAALFLRQPLG